MPGDVADYTTTHHDTTNISGLGTKHLINDMTLFLFLSWNVSRHPSCCRVETHDVGFLGAGVTLLIRLCIFRKLQTFMQVSSGFVDKSGSGQYSSGYFPTPAYPDANVLCSGEL